MFTVSVYNDSLATPRCFVSIDCLDIGNQVGPNVYCRFDETCTSISCCINLKLFIYRHSLKAFIRYDPCDMELRLGFNAWTTSYSVVDENFGK